jgi:amidase
MTTQAEAAMATTGSTPNPPLEPAAPDAGDLVFAPAAELARRIRRRAVSAAELLDALLAHIARHNPQLNAIVALDAEAARLRAREADAALARGEDWGPLHGVPVTLKDFHLTAGLRTTWGMAALADHVPTRDSAIPARLKTAGAIIVGKTNIDLGFPDNPLPRANNPWDLERTPGGSSTGAAAAVAAGLSPLDIGSDLGGSVLNPAHYCGIFGMRPTERRVSLAGLSGDPLPDIARSVEDLRLAMQSSPGRTGAIVKCRPCPGAPYRPWRSASSA